MKKQHTPRHSLKSSNWISLSSVNSSHNKNQFNLTQPLFSRKNSQNNDTQRKTSLNQVSMIIDKQNKKPNKIPRFSDLVEFEKQNFPGSKILKTCQYPKYQKQCKIKQNPMSILKQLTPIERTLQSFVKQSRDYSIKSQTIYNMHIEVITQYYNQLHLMLEVQKNKHCNNIIIMKNNCKSKFKITQQMSEIYLQEISSLIQRNQKLLYENTHNIHKRIEKFNNFINNNKPGLQVYNFQLNNIEQIKNTFLSLIKIDCTQKQALSKRRKKSQSMEPRLKTFSPNQIKFNNQNIQIKQSIIESSCDLQYSDGQHQQDNKIQSLSYLYK